MLQRFGLSGVMLLLAAACGASQVTVDASQVTYGPEETVPGNPAAARLSERTDRQIVSATLETGVDGLSGRAARYTALLPSGGSYTRTVLTYTNETESPLTFPALTVNETTAFAAREIASVTPLGNTDGSVLRATASDGSQHWFAIEHPFAKYEKPGSGSTVTPDDPPEFLRERLAFPSPKTTYALEDLSNISQPKTNHTTGMGMLYIPVQAEAGSLTLTMTYSEGAWAALFSDVTVYAESGLVVTEVSSGGDRKTGTEKVSEEVYKPYSTDPIIVSGLTPGTRYLLAVKAGADYDEWNDGGGSSGTISLTGATAATGIFHRMLDDTFSETGYSGITPAIVTTSEVSYDQDAIADSLLELPIVLTAGTAQLTVDHTGGTHRVEIDGLEILKDGIPVWTETYQTNEAYSGDEDVNNTFDVSGMEAYCNQPLTARFKLWINEDQPNHTGKIICTSNSGIATTPVAVSYSHADLTDTYLEVPLAITGTTLQLTVEHTAGTHRVEIGGLELYTETGDLIQQIEQTGYAGTQEEYNSFTVSLGSAYTGNYVIARFNLWVDNATPDHYGKIICTDGATPVPGYLPSSFFAAEDAGGSITGYPEKTTYTYEDVTNTDSAEDGTYGHGIIDVPIRVDEQDFSVKIQCSSGDETYIYKVELIDYETASVIDTKDYTDGWSYIYCDVSDAYTWDTTSSNNAFLFDSAACDALVGKYAVVRFYVGVEGFGSTSGYFSATNATLTAITESSDPEPDPDESDGIPVWTLCARVPLENMTLAAGKQLTFSYVTGSIAEGGQFRRAFNEYLNAERAHPHRMLPHYNSWYDICINRNGNDVSGRFKESEALASMQAFRTELWEKRGVSIDSYLWDDGWDDWYSLWDFNANFQPQGFANLADEAHKVPGASIAAWMSPFGGYGTSFNQRVAYAKQQGYIPSTASGLDLSAETYYNAFRDRVLQMITDYDMNLFKFDRMGTGGDATGADSGFNAQLMAVGNLCAEMRAAKPDVFINATVGTWGSPYWLMWADSIWRGGNDVGPHYGEEGYGSAGTARQKWVTYRDNKIHDRFVMNGCLLPLNSLMMHGIVVCSSTGTGVDLQASTSSTVDFATEVWMGMTLGTGLQEYYITPSLMSETWWDILAKGVKYLKANATVFTDSHWIGGDPSAAVYGYASLGERKGIITLRNPTSSEKTVTSSLDAWLEMPEALQGRAFTFKTIFNSTAEYENAGKSGAFALPSVTTTDTEVSWTLPAYATVVFEVNFANSREALIDASRYTTLSAWQTATSTADLSGRDITLDFSAITANTAFTFDAPVSTSGLLSIVGNQLAVGNAKTLPVATVKSTADLAVGSSLVETSITTDADFLNKLKTPEIRDGAVLTLAADSAVTLTAKPAGSGEVKKIGAGTLNLAGGVYRVQMTVSEGNMAIAGASQFTEMVAVDPGATLTVDAQTTFSGLVAPNGTMVLNAPVAFDRNLTVSSAGARITGTATLTQRCNVQVASGASLAVSVPVVLGSPIAKSGAGALTINGGDITVEGSIGINYGTCAMTVAEGKFLAGDGTVGFPVTLADGAVIDGTAGAPTVAGQVTAKGTVTVTNAEVNAPFLTYTGTAPAAAGSVFLAERAFAVSETAGDVVTLKLLPVARPTPSDTVSPAEADAAAQQVADALAAADDAVAGKAVSEIRNAGAVGVVEGAEIVFSPLDDGTLAATYTYDFAVTELALVTVEGAAALEVTAALDGTCAFAEGVTFSLVDPDGVQLAAAENPAVALEGNRPANTQVFRLPLQAADGGAVLLKVRAAKAAE